MHTFTKNGLPAEKKGRYPLDLRLSQSATLVRITGGCRQARLLTSLGGAVRYYQTIPFTGDTSSNARFFRNIWVFYIPVLYFGVVMSTGGAELVSECKIPVDS